MGRPLRHSIGELVLSGTTTREQTMKKPQLSVPKEAKLGLQPIDPETARNAQVLRDSQPIGAGCLVSSKEILTCAHVVRRATGVDDPRGRSVEVILMGVADQPL